VKRQVRFSTKKAGLPPGSLVRHGFDPDVKTKVRMIDFSADGFYETEIRSLEDLLPFKQQDTVTWIDIVGASQVEVLGKIGEMFGIHNLVLEDMLNTSHRPKVEDYGEYLFFILKNIRIHQGELLIEQVSLLVGNHYVISFLENDFDVFAPVRNRLRAGKGKIRKVGTDYLGYALIDMIVDNYYLALEDVGEQLELLEDDVLLSPDPKHIKRIQSLRNDLLFIRKAVWPLREVLGSLERGYSEIFKPETQLFIRDVYDHAIQIIDTVETYREMVGSLMDIYLSSVSNRMNEVMKVLTIISTIFIPLTFLAGLEGMNFKYMPELEWEYGYPLLLAIMLSVMLGMLRFFRSKKWL
jgi:magnesium transporter